MFSTVTFRGTSKCPIAAHRTFFWPISYRDKRKAWLGLVFAKFEVSPFFCSFCGNERKRGDLFNLVSLGTNLERLVANKNIEGIGRNCANIFVLVFNEIG